MESNFLDYDSISFYDAMFGYMGNELTAKLPVCALIACSV